MRTNWQALAMMLAGSILAGCGTTQVITPPQASPLPSASIQFSRTVEAPMVEPDGDFEITRSPPELHEFNGTHTNNIGLTLTVTMPYFLYLPDGYQSEPERDYPLILRLHGYNGTTAVDIDNIEPPALPQPLHERQENFPFIVIIPIVPAFTDWAGVTDSLDQLVEEAIDSYRVDDSQVYLIGFSMGGAGVWAYGSEYSQRFAAIASVGGYWPHLENEGVEIEQLCNLQETSIWVFHTAPDFAVPVKYADTIVAFLDESCGIEELYTRYEDADHVESARRAYGNAELYEWLLSYSK